MGEVFLTTIGDLGWWFVLVAKLGEVEFILFNVWGNGGGDSLGDRIFIAASSRVSGNAGEGDLLDTGD